MDALEPHISKETIEFHYGKHHQTYVDNLNKFAEKDTSIGKHSLDELVKTAAPAGPIFNNAAQVWNHTFYWNSLSPNGGGKPTGPLAQQITKDFGSFEAFKEKFSQVATGHFASGWAWLVKTDDGKLKIVDTHDAGNPLRDRVGKPLLTLDVWEHAYYIGYRNARAKYVESFWNVVNWDFASKNFSDI
jgi:Fe-Mn family superoxide dismutase